MPKTAWRMVCIGPGPGPKNVLAERHDGFRTVIPYAIWKHKLSKELVEEPLRGNLDLQHDRLSIGGLVAVYSAAERELLRGLPAREVLVIHELKALFGGEILDPDDESLTPEALATLAPSAVPGTEKGPAPTPRRRRGEPLPGQTALAG